QPAAGTSGSVAAPVQAATTSASPPASLVLYQVRFFWLPTNVNVSWMGEDTAGARVSARSVVQVAPTPQPCVGSVRCVSRRISDVQSWLVGPVRPPLVTSPFPP